MAAFADFDRFIRPFIMNAPVPAIQDALLDAAIEFCEKSRLITQILEDKFSIAANQAEIEIDSPDGELAIAQPVNVWTATGKLQPKSKIELDDLYPSGWPTKTTGSLDSLLYWLSLSRPTLRLVPYLTVSASAALTIEVALKPTRAAATLPDVLLQDWAEDIAAGALARLNEHPLPYAMPDRVKGYRNAFDRAIVRAADYHARGFNKPVLRTLPDEMR